MMMMMIMMMRMTMTMTMIVVMRCNNSTSYVLTESPSTSQNSFRHCLYFLFSYKRSAALGQFVIHRGLIISVMQVGWHALHLNFPYFMRRASWLTSPLANKLSSGIFFCCKKSSPLYSRRYWKDKTLWQLKKKKKNRGRGRIPTLYLSSFSKQSRGYLGVIGLDLCFNQFFQRLKIWRAAGDIRPSRVTSRPETNSEGFWEQI